ncbi:MAG: hypothetical protein ACRDV0_08415, partial [Acidimicrobiales bacterium]
RGPKWRWAIAIGANFFGPVAYLRKGRVHPGGHDALQDARAAVDVFLEQVVRNNAGQRPLDLLAAPATVTDEPVERTAR